MLRQNDCIKLITASGGGDLEAKSGESFLVKGLFVHPSASDDYLTLKIDNFTVGYYRLKGKSGNHLGGHSMSLESTNLLSELIKRGLPFTYPVAEGQTFSVSRYAETGEVVVLYDRYDAGDVRADMPCGTAANSYGFLQYLRESAVITASGDLLLDTSITPAEFPDFPAGKAVPANSNIKLHGIAACAVGDGSGSDNIFYSTYLKLVKEREVLFDEDRAGFYFRGNSGAYAVADYRKSRSIIGSHTEFAEVATFVPWRPAFFFSEPVEFTSGEELLVYLTFVKVGTFTMSANLADVALILEVTKV